MPLLRASRDDFFALLGKTSEERGISQEFVEKDYWVTELLRAVALEEEGITTIFKGGTSLLKAFHVINRFSEDVDVLAQVRQPMGKGRVDKGLKAICERAREQLGVQTELVTSSTGLHRSVRYLYPQLSAGDAVRPGVLLELGIRGGADPHERRSVRSFISEYATSSGLAKESDFGELSAVELECLAPERTLVEKLALLHHFSSIFPKDEDHLLRLAGRNLYDVFHLLNNDRVVGVLHKESKFVATIAADVDAHSTRGGFDHTPRPSNGYGASPAFDEAGSPQQVMKRSYDNIRSLVVGPLPPYEDVLKVVRSRREQL